MAKSASRTFPVWMIIVYAVLGVGCAGMLIYGAVKLAQPHGLACLMAGIFGLVMVAASVPLAILLHAMASRNYSFSTSRAAESLLEKIHETNMLSDNAKRVLFRERELNLLRRTIEEDITHGDINAGLTL